MCMNQRPIKCRDMHVGGLDSELHDTRVQYNNLNSIIIHYRLKYSASRNKHTIEWIRGL